jgi:5-methylcytosine-specific restriction protein A
MPYSPPQHRAAFTPSREAVKKASAKHYNKHIRKGHEFYHSKEWKETRKWFAKRHPLCIVCKANGIAQSVEIVDHIIEIKDGGSMLCVTNLQSLCRRHHNTKTAQAVTERGGRVESLQPHNPGNDSEAQFLHLQNEAFPKVAG